MYPAVIFVTIACLIGILIITTYLWFAFKKVKQVPSQNSPSPQQQSFSPAAVE